MNTLAGIGVFPVELVTAYIDIKAAEEGFDFFGYLGGVRSYLVLPGFQWPDEVQHLGLFIEGQVLKFTGNEFSVSHVRLLHIND